MPDQLSIALGNMFNESPALDVMSRDFNEVQRLASIAALFNAGAFGPTGNAGIAPGGSSSGGGGGGMTGTPTTPGRAVTTFVDSMDYVDDGDVIRAAHHNSLLDAIRIIARLLDTGEITQQVEVSPAPVLWSVPNSDAFVSDQGFSRGPTGSPQSVAGWLPLDLPDGYVVNSLRVWGVYPGTSLSSWAVSVQRVAHGKEDDDAVIEGNLKSTLTTFGAAFDTTFTFDRNSRTVAQADELSLVDTSKYRYRFLTTVLKPVNSQDLKLLSVQVMCTRAGGTL